MDLFLRESSRTDHATWKFGRPASYRDSRCAMIPEAATRSRRVLGQRRILLFEALPHGHIPARIVFGEGLWTPAGRSYRCSPRYTWTPSRKRRRNDCRRTRGYRVTCICRHGSGSSALCPDPDLLHQLSPSYRAASASVAVDGKAIQLLWSLPRPPPALYSLFSLSHYHIHIGRHHEHHDDAAGHSSEARHHAYPAHGQKHGELASPWTASVDVHPGNGTELMSRDTFAYAERGEALSARYQHLSRLSANAC